MPQRNQEAIIGAIVDGLVDSLLGQLGSSGD
ncbi:hypothetical protein M2359_003875 [Gordonia amarae]|nr:hypothetical protein [Gordonia amarae]